MFMTRMLRYSAVYGWNYNSNGVKFREYVWIQSGKKRFCLFCMDLVRYGKTVAPAD